MKVINLVATIQSCLLHIRTTTRSQRLLANRKPSRQSSHKCLNSSLSCCKIEPSLHNSSICRAFASSQIAKCHILASIGVNIAAPAQELKVSWVTCRVGGGSRRHPAHSPPHLRYCILSTLTPPISLLLFMRTGPLKFWIWILSMICLSRGSLKAPVTLML